MRVTITIDPKDPLADYVRDDAEPWLRYHARAGWRVHEDEDLDGRALLMFEFSDPLDAMDFHYFRPAASEHRGRLR